MYCPQCGTQNDNSAAFCKNCGVKLEGVATKSTLATENKTEITNYTPSVRYADDSVLNAVKKLVLSPLSFVAALAFSLMIIFSISNAEVLGINLLGYLSQLEYLFAPWGIFEFHELISELYALSGFFRLLVTLGMIPEIVIAIGMWMTVYTSFQKGDEFSLSGIKAIKVINAISFVFAIIGLVTSAGLYLWLLQFVHDKNITLPVGSAFIMLICIGIIGFNVYYKKQILNVINCFISTVNGRTPYVPGKFVAVMCLIACGSYTILGIMYPSAVTWCSAIAFLCFGVLIIKMGNVLTPLRPKSRLLNEIDNTDSGITEPCAETPDAESTVQTPQDVSAKGGSNSKKAVAVIAGLAALVLIIIFIASTSVAPGIDKAIVGKWQYGSNEEAAFEFRRNGVFISNEGTEYEERGTYTAGNGVISVVISGEAADHEYRVIDSDKIQIYRSYITSNWERKYRWETLYRVD